ncbi:monocarboxylate transporter 12-like [Haliotis asinina]|uniref:monocarboxylate transporter 12-like n=1 Tax=Haliotis asinina TaxID=109174 RepID=UPI003531DAAC
MVVMSREDTEITENLKLQQNQKDETGEGGNDKEENDTGTDGFAGWIVVFSSFGIHALFHGLALSFGVIFEELLDYFSKGRGETALVGSLVFGVQSVAAPVVGILTDRYGCRAITICGAAIAAFGLTISTFAQSISVLYFTYGVLFGLAFALVSVPSKVIINQHMKQRRSLANCVSSSGSGVGSACLSASLHQLSNSYGWRGMTLITGSLLLNGIVFGGLFFPKKKRKVAQETTDTRNFSLRRSCCQNDFTKLFRNIRYCFFLMSNCLAMNALYTPYTHLPRRATDLKIKEAEINWLLPIIGIASVIGRLFFGWLGDFHWVNNRHLLASALMICGISSVVCPFLTTFPMLAGFAVVFGAFSGVFYGTRNVVLVDVVGVDKLSKAYGILLMSQGLSSILGPPLAGWIYDSTGDYSASFYTVGCMFIASSVILLMQQKAEMIWKQRKNQSICTLTASTPIDNAIC